MAIVLLIAGVVFLCWLSVCVRVILQNPIKAVYYAVKDSYTYIRFKRWRECPTGEIIGFVGLFGKGKTLSAVHYAAKYFFYRYHDKKVYDFERKKWVTQKVHIVSNVDINIPTFSRFTSLAQLVSIADNYKKIDEKNDTRTIHLFVGDEFSVQLNSRSFKSNFDPLVLNSLLTCRHHFISLVYTAQRFGHVDALLRQVTSFVISCEKCWRIMVHKKYDAYELENASNIMDVQPLSRYGWFICDSDYKAYDTLACVEQLKKSCEEGDMLSEAEILALQQNTPSDMDAVQKPSRRYLKRMKKSGKRG